jgi:hypothetical protein
MALSSEQLLIAEVIGYEPVTEDEGWAQYPADVDYQDAPKGAIPCTGNVYRNKKGILRCYWIPTSGKNGQYTSKKVKNSLAGTTCQASRTSKSTPSTQSASLLLETT